MLRPERRRSRSRSSAHARGCGLLAHELERAPQERLLASGIARLVRGVRGALKQVDLAHARDCLGIGHSLPQSQGALEQRELFAERVHALGGRRRAHRGRERLRLVARRRPVVRRLGGDVGAGLTGVDPVLERTRQRRVHRGALARQQVVVDHLAQQRVAEAVAVVGDRDHDLARNGLAQALAELAGLEPRHGGHQSVVGRRLAREPRSTSCAFFDSRSTRSISASRNVGGSVAAPVEARGEHLLGEQRFPSLRA